MLREDDQRHSTKQHNKIASFTGKFRIFVLKQIRHVGYAQIEYKIHLKLSLCDMFETIFHIRNEIELHNCSEYCHAQISLQKHIPNQTIQTCHPLS